MAWGSKHDCGCTAPYDKNHCRYGLWAPGRDNADFERDNIGNTAFNLFAMMTEREAAIEKFIEHLSNSDDPNDYWNQRAASEYADLNMNSLASYEQKYIEQEVAERWHANN